jgi:voltage-gated potassium channel
MSVDAPGGSTTPTVESFMRARHRRALRVALVRTFLGATVLLALYYTLPLDGGLDTGGGLLLFVGLVVFSLLLAFQIWQVTKAEHPRMRAIETLATCVPVFVILFAATYFVMDQNTDEAFSEPLTRTDSLYFTVTVFSTVGFGDITPVTQAARIATMVQMITGLVLVGLVARILFSAVDIGLRRKGESGSGSTHP